MKTLSIKVRKNRQRKCATCFATLVQNKSQSDVSRVANQESNLKCCCRLRKVVAKKLESSSTFHKLFIIPLKNAFAFNLLCVALTRFRLNTLKTEHGKSGVKCLSVELQSREIDVKYGRFTFTCIEKTTLHSSD